MEKHPPVLGGHCLVLVVVWSCYTGLMRTIRCVRALTYEEQPGFVIRDLLTTAVSILIGVGSFVQPRLLSQSFKSPDCNCTQS